MCDLMSARPSDVVAFKVSCKGSAPYSARLVRSISADPNPAGQGVVEEAADAYFEPQSFAPREQPFYPGSYAESTQAVAITFPFSMSAFVYPTLAKDSPQVVLSIGPISLMLNEQGCLTLEVGDTRISVATPLKLRAWHMVSASIDATGQAIITQTPHDTRAVIVCALPRACSTGGLWIISTARLKRPRWRGYAGISRKISARLACRAARLCNW